MDSGETRPGSGVPRAVVERLAAARRVLAVCHERPEADALGSVLAVTLAVEARGAEATPVCADRVPHMYGFMPAIERFRTDPDGEDYDLIVVGDCGELERVGAVLERHRPLFARVPVLNIDHHVSNQGFGTVAWVDPLAAATCEMVALALGELGVPLAAADGAVASALLSGIVMDTAAFQHPNATPRTLRVAADLVAAGAPLAEIARRIYRTKPNAQLKLFGLVLARLAAEGDRIVHATLSRADLAATGATSEQSEGLIDLLSQSESADMAILFKEDGPTTRISVRTRAGTVDATRLAGAFGGGGHARAAGATIERPLAEARPLVLAEARRLVNDGP